MSIIESHQKSLMHVVVLERVDSGRWHPLTKSVRNTIDSYFVIDYILELRLKGIMMGVIKGCCILISLIAVISHHTMYV